jgi:CRISPR type III-A/MTUBE-associated protein Csm6
MKDYVLFSPIGRSDPTRGSFEGPFLHILHHYKPKKAYIFLTSEICKYHKHDNRYVILAKRICPECEIIPLEYDDIVEAHKFELFDIPFQKELERVALENPNCNYIANASSGTPQMEAALYVLAAKSDIQIKLIQVGTFESKSNNAQFVGLNYDIEKEWDELTDRISKQHEDSRCVEITPENLKKRFIFEIIRSHIASYDYKAALQACESLGGLANQELVNLISSAYHRAYLNTSKAKELAKKTSYDLNLIEQQKPQEIFEFILYLKIKSKRGEIAEFARAVSPVLTELFQEYLDRVHNIKIKSLCNYIKIKDVYKLSRQKLSEIYGNDFLSQYYDTEKFGGSFKDTPLAANNILPMIEYSSIRKICPEDFEKANVLRDFEENIRNKASHQLTYMDEDILKKKYSHSVNDILDKIQYFFKITYREYAKKMKWNAYDLMNEEICKLLNV